MLAVRTVWAGNGYKEVRHPDGRRQQEHRFIWEQAHGPLPNGFVLHHKNGIRHDNRLENLQLMTRSEHSLLHRPSDRERIAAKVKAWWANPDNRAKRIAQLRASWQRPEQRTRMSAAARKRCATEKGRTQLEDFLAAGREARGQAS